jgi:hypothetical protein
MKINMLVISDVAYVDSATGKLYLLGVFDRVKTRNEFPIKYSRMAVTARFAAETLEPLVPHAFEIRLTDTDGMDLLQVAGTITLARDETGKILDTTTILEVNEVEFPHPGTYEFSAWIGGEKVGDAPLDIVKASASPR